MTPDRNAETSTGSPAHLRIVTIRGKGRGVVAARRIAEGELVERSPVLVIPAEDWRLVQDTIISKFCFSWRDGTDETALALGYASLLNHSYAPNVYCHRRIRQRVLEFVALRDIEEGEEITLNYNGDPDSREPVDFRVLGP